MTSNRPKTVPDDPRDSPPPFQFSLRSLFGLLIGMGLLFGGVRVVGLLTVFIACFALLPGIFGVGLICAAIRGDRVGQSWSLGLLVIVIGYAAFVVAWLAQPRPIWGSGLTLATLVVVAGVASSINKLHWLGVTGFLLLIGWTLKGLLSLITMPPPQL
ncbi:MAG: hypothetical protein N2C14_31255, partial [Planctomycetales bacterium]